VVDRGVDADAEFDASSTRAEEAERNVRIVHQQSAHPVNLTVKVVQIPLY